MLNHTLIKRSLAVGLTAAAAAFPAAAQAEYAVDSGGVQSAAQVPVTGPQTALNRLHGNVQQWFTKHGHFTGATAPSSTDASSGGYNFPSSVASTTAQPGSSFHWGDAGIGAGSAAVLLGASSLGAVAMRRRRPHGTLAS